MAMNRLLNFVFKKDKAKKSKKSVAKKPVKKKPVAKKAVVAKKSKAVVKKTSRAVKKPVKKAVKAKTPIKTVKKVVKKPLKKAVTVKKVVLKRVAVKKKGVPMAVPEPKVILHPDHELYLSRRAHYMPLSECRNPNLQKVIMSYMGSTDKESILMPSIEQPNYPILLMENNTIEDKHHFTLFHALCIQPNNRHDVMLAVTHQADMNLTTTDGFNALFLSILYAGKTDTEKANFLNFLFSQAKMTEQTIAAFHKDIYSQTVFHYALQYHLNESLATLIQNTPFHLDRFVDVEAPLVTAVRHYNLEGLKVLLMSYTTQDLIAHLADEAVQEKLMAAFAELKTREERHHAFITLGAFADVSLLACKIDL